MDGIERFKGPGGRYYQLWVQRDLFGALVIMRAWGGQRSGRGGFKAISLASDMECHKELKRIRCPRSHWLHTKTCAWQRAHRKSLPVGSYKKPPAAPQ